jgi:hypothetical protein
VRDGGEAGAEDEQGGHVDVDPPLHHHPPHGE